LFLLLRLFLPLFAFLPVCLLLLCYGFVLAFPFLQLLSPPLPLQRPPLLLRKLRGKLFACAQKARGVLERAAGGMQAFDTKRGIARPAAFAAPAMRASAALRNCSHLTTMSLAKGSQI
jgi:hypothetical protein